MLSLTTLCFGETHCALLLGMLRLSDEETTFPDFGSGYWIRMEAGPAMSGLKYGPSKP
jgi:hypothetical protein